MVYRDMWWEVPDKRRSLSRMTIAQSDSIKRLTRDGREEGFAIGLMIGMCGTLGIWVATVLWW